MLTHIHKLANLADVFAGYLTREAVHNTPAGTHYLLQIRDFNADRSAINVADMVRISPKPRAALCTLQAGDVLFLAKGTNTFAFAVSALPSPTLAASCFFILRPKPAILSGYLAWFLNHDSTRALQTRLATTGARMPVIRRDILATLDIPLPPVTIQKTIVALESLRLQEQALLADLAQKQQDLIASVCMSTARRVSGITTTEEGIIP